MKYKLLTGLYAQPPEAFHIYETLQGARIAAGRARSKIGKGGWSIITGPEGFCETMEN